VFLHSDYIRKERMIGRGGTFSTGQEQKMRDESVSSEVSEN